MEDSLEGDTSSLRTLAPRWSLAGDDQLLNLMQNTHKKLISKCQEVNNNMEEMVGALDSASITLQNVNNKFMALSNSQFIESRVFDDDADVSAEPAPVKEPPKLVTAESEVAMLKRSLAVLESMHEVVTILRDSDTESDSDDENVARVVLKPKDVYADRPLPYIIGSHAWRSKWHAGLVVEDSDTDSTTSKLENRDSEQYSESEPEDVHIQADKLQIPQQNISETSSEIASEQDIQTPVATKQTPSDVAAELARRLGGQSAQVIDEEPEEFHPQVPAVRKVYRPEQPAAATIFPDEPPPLDQYESEESLEDDNDIFAELHKKQPYDQDNKDRGRLADDLFDFNKPSDTKGDIFSDFAKDKIVINANAKQKPTLFDDESEPELFAQAQPTVVARNDERTENDTNIKVSGRSLQFVSYQHPHEMSIQWGIESPRDDLQDAIGADPYSVQDGGCFFAQNGVKAICVCQCKHI